MARRRRPPAGGKRHYPRVARVNELLRQVIADELERIDDPELGLTTVTAVDADREFRTATVYVGHLDDDISEALESHRPRLQSAINQQVRLKRTPELRFAADPSIESGARVEEILRDLNRDRDEADGEDDDASESEGGAA